MKTIAILLAAVGILSGCVVYPYEGGHGRHGGYYRDHDRGQYWGNRDRDGDGVQNRRDHRPDNPYRN